MTAAAGGQPAVAESALTSTIDNGNPRVYYLGGNNDVYELAWSGSNWNASDVTKAAGGTPAGAGSALTSTIYSGNPRVYYFGSHNNAVSYTHLTLPTKRIV